MKDKGYFGKNVTSLCFCVLILNNFVVLTNYFRKRITQEAWYNLGNEASKAN